VAGVRAVEELGAGVTRFAVDDHVFGMPRPPQQAGATASTSPHRLASSPGGRGHKTPHPVAGDTSSATLLVTP
jgi:NADPH:quinone reductase-like Zn-dependent oxidoreductase